jgi:hypothetical protein
MAMADRTRNTIRHHWPFFGGPVTSSVLLAGFAITLVAAALGTGVWAGILGIVGILLVVLAVASRALIVLYQWL